MSLSQRSNLVSDAASTDYQIPSVPATAASDVALFIDWENLKWSLKHKFQTEPNISSLVEAAKEHGRLVTARAYADWTQPVLGIDAPNLYRAGIEPVYVPGRHPLKDVPLRNSADVRLAVDAVDLCGRLAHIATYVLVTGDGDLIHAVNFLRLHGRQTIIVGVEDTMNVLLATAADKVLLYERDVEPLSNTESRLIDVSPTPRTTSNMDVAFEWVKEILRENKSNKPYPFSALGHELKQRRGFDARRSYRISFKRFMLAAQAAGHVHLNTMGGLDYVVLTDVSESDFDVATLAIDNEDTKTPIQELGRSLSSSFEIRLETLSDQEQVSLIGFIRELEKSSPYMTFKYIVKNLIYHSALPRLSQEQINRVIHDLVDRDMLLKSQEAGAAPDNRAPIGLVKLALNGKHRLIRKILQRPALVEAQSRPRVDPFAELQSALEEAQRNSRFGYYPSVQGILETRLGSRLRDLGYSRPSVFFQEAERRGLVRLGQLDNGAPIILRPHEKIPPESEKIPPEGEMAEPQLVLPKLGDLWTREALRVIATAEDQVGGIAHHASLILQVRHTLTANGGPVLKTGEVNRLIKREFVRDGYVEAFRARVVHHESGEPFETEVYRLRRDHPDVIQALSAGPTSLSPDISVRPLHFAE